MAERPRDLKDIFAEALGRPAGPERSAYLDGACRGDADLRGQVEGLIEAHDRAGRFLGSAPEATSDADAPAGAGAGAGPPETLAVTTANGVSPGPRPVAEGPGDRIGPYRLLQKIGEGGMGVVFLAEQEHPVRRRVALKVIKAGMDSETVVARFEAERQALALMDHPGIARVLDAGATDSGRPFFVMELVNGVPITEYCDAARLDTRQRLELFAGVCRAVQHAHQKGIIHRDIKPTNVLVTVVDGRPAAKVIDFGVAKATDQRLTERTLFTRFGGIVGTLEYMSPEQAEPSGQDIDTRADVYSLGVLLYELLTGTTPLERSRLREAGFAEILRRIREEEPPRPSNRLSSSGDHLPSIAATRGTEPRRLTRAVRGELDWIAMRALEKDRSRRYETAIGFARDVERYLAGEAVEAGPPSRRYRLSKFARRHRAALATAGSFAALLALGAAVSLAWALRATRAERETRAESVRAQRAEARALAEAGRAREAEAQARAEADRALKAEAQARDEGGKAKAIGEFLAHDLLGQAEPGHNAVEDRVTLLEVLDRAAEKVGGRFGPRPEVESALRETIARAYHGLASWEKAERQWRAVLESARRRLGPDSAEAYFAQGELAHILGHRGRRDAEVLALLESSAEGLGRVLGPDHPDTLLSRHNLADAYLAAGRGAEAVALHESTLAARERVLGPDHPVTLQSRNNLAAAYWNLGQLGRSVPLLESTLAARERVLGPDHPGTLVSRNGLASAYLAAGRAAEAVALLQSTLAARERLLGPDHPVTLVSRNGLAGAYRAAGRGAEAVALLKSTLAARERVLGPDHPDTLQSRHNLADAYLAAGRGAEAVALHESTLAARERVLGPDHPVTLQSRNNLAAAYWNLGQLGRSVPLLESTLAARERVLGPDHPDTLTTRVNLGVNLFDAGRRDEGLRLMEDALRRGEARPGGLPAPLGWVEPNLADKYDRAGLPGRSERFHRKAHGRALGQFGPDDPRTAAAAATLGLNLLQQRKWTEAEPVLRGCLRVREATAPDAWTTFNTRSMLGGSLLGLGRHEEAEPLVVGGYEGMKSREASIPPQGRSRLAEAAGRVVRLYESWGRAEEASAWKARLGLEDLPEDVFTEP